MMQKSIPWMGVFLLFGLSSGEAHYDTASLAPPYDELYRKMLSPEGDASKVDSATTSAALRDDLADFHSDPTFRCQFPYRYKLFQQSGITPRTTPPDGSPNCVHPILVSSTDEKVIGKPFYFVNLDPKKVKRIQIGRSKTGIFNFGHSFIKIDLCEDADCTRPREIAIHPGADKNGNISYAARSYADMLAAFKTRKDLSVDLVDVDLSDPNTKESFLASIYERAQNKSGKYKLLSHNCATSVDDLVQFGSMKPVKKSFLKSLTPSSVLGRIASLFRRPVKPVSPYREKGDRAIQSLAKNFGIKVAKDFESYAKLSPDKRFCNSANPSGIKSEINRSLDQQPLVAAGHASRIAQGTETRNSRMCQKLKEAAASVLNQIGECGVLENQVSFDKKVGLNRTFRGGKSLEQMQGDYASTLSEVATLVNGPAGSKRLTAAQFAERMNALEKTSQGKALTAKLADLATSIGKESKSVGKNYQDVLKDTAGESQGKALMSYYHHRLEQDGGLLAECNRQSCPLKPSQTNPRRVVPL